MKVSLIKKEKYFSKNVSYYPFLRRWVDKNTQESILVVQFEPYNFKNYIEMSLEDYIKLDSEDRIRISIRWHSI